MGNGQTIQAVSLFYALLINDAFEAKCKRIHFCRHGLVGTLRLWYGIKRGISSLIKLFKKILDFKKGFIDAGCGTIRSKFSRLNTYGGGGTFGPNPSKEVFDPNVGFLHGRRNFVPPFSDGISLLLFDLISAMMNSGFIIILDSLPKFKGGRVNFGLIPYPKVRFDTQVGVLAISGI